MGLDSKKTSGTPMFVREATGLVRERNWVDLIFWNGANFVPLWGIILALSFAPLYGGDPAFSMLLTAPGIIAQLGVFYLLNVSMPRSGGDYVYNSRILGPALGLAANWLGSGAMLVWFWVADSASLYTSTGMAQTFSVYGALTNSPWADNLASWVTQPWNNFLLGIVAIVLFTIIVVFSNRLYFLVQNTVMIVSILGIVAIMALEFYALSNPSAFIASFNSYATRIHANLLPDAYDNVSAIAASSAPDHSVTNIPQNLMAVPLWMTVFVWFYASAWLGGETKNVRSSAKRALFGSFAVFFLLTMVVVEVAYYAFGFNFLLGIDYIFYGYVPNPLGAPPSFMLLAGIMANNPELVLFLGFTVIAEFLILIPLAMIVQSRVFLAYAFDRIAPARLADVSDRFHTPYVALIVCTIGSLIMLPILSGVFGSSSASTVLALGIWAGVATIGTSFLFVSIAGILFPYLRKDLYELACPVRKKIAGIPLITWAGIISTIYMAATVIAYTADQTFYFGGCPAGGIIACGYNSFLIIIGAIFVATILYYYGVRWYRAKQGVLLSLIFKEIPPE